MTIDAAHADDPGPVTCGQVRARLDGLAAEYAALMGDVAADRDQPDLARRVTALTVAFREARAQLAGHVFTDAFTTEKTAAAAPPGRHAAPPRRVADVIPLRRPRGAAHGLAPAAVAVALAGHGARHAITAHLRLALTTAAAAGVTAAGVTYTIQATPDQRPVPLPAAAAPAVSPAAVATSDPDDLAVPRLVKRHRQPARPAAPPLLAAPVPPPAGTPAPTPAPTPGVLNIQQAAVTLTQTAPGQYTGQLVLYATGGPARWHVDWLGTDSAVTVDQESGIITDGQQAIVTVTVDAALVSPGQSWTLTVDPDGQQITVTAAG